MTDRPTRARVEYALEAVQFDCRSYRNNARLLAAEVRALREEVQRLMATITRVEELCGMNHKDSLIRVGDIRAALRGENHD